MMVFLREVIRKETRRSLAGISFGKGEEITVAGIRDGHDPGRLKSKNDRA
jgi:hypothetical protein